MATLYEIDSAILNCIDTETGEVIDGEMLEALQIERDEKIEKVALWYKNLLSDAEAYKAEKTAFAEREQAAKKKAESIKEWLASALDGTSFKTAKTAISFRTSESVVVDDLFMVSENYLRYKEPEVDKASVKKAIKAGETIKGVHIEEKRNISIK